VSLLLLLFHLDLPTHGVLIAPRLLPACLTVLTVWLVSIRADVPYAQLRQPWTDAFSRLSKDEASRMLVRGGQ
jgi:hypothetical protein